MLSYIKRKLSESDSVASGSNNSNSTTSAELVRKTSEMSLDNGVIAYGEDALLHELGYRNATDLQETIYGKHIEKKPLNYVIYIYSTLFKDLLRSIRDPEKPCTLEDLNVIYEDGIFVMTPTRSNVSVVSGELY